MPDSAKKLVIVLGAPGGLATAICRKLLKDGYIVVVAGRNTAKIAELVSQLGEPAAGAFFDAYDPASIEALVESTAKQFGRIDALVNLVADTSLMYDDRQVLNTSLDIWDKAFNSSVRAYYIAIRAVLPYMLGTENGAIVNISSIGALQGDDWLTAYASAKAAILELTRNVAVQYGQRGIRCNSICPGIIVHGRVREALPRSIERAQAISCATRNGRPEDIGSLVSYLLSDGAGFINGQTIVADGGLTIRAAEWRTDESGFSAR